MRRRPGVTVGHGCVIGAGAIVTKDIPAGHVASGNPARLLRKVALDVPDAPDLRYEHQGQRVIVITSKGRDAAKNAVYTSKSPLPGFSSPVVASAGTTFVALKGTAADDASVTASMIGVDRAQQDHEHALRCMDQREWVLIGVQALVLVVAVFGAWWIVHTLLY